MSSLRILFRIAGATAFAGLFVAACSAEGTAGFVSEADAGSTPLPEASTPTDGGGAAVVDGADGPALPAAQCGNRKLESGEQCDDGNTTGSDGCSASCAIETAFEGDVCPGKPIGLEPEGASLKGHVTGSTKSAFNHYGSGCGGGSAKDVVYTFTPPSSGKAIVKLSADYAAIASARTTCTSATSESTCAEIPALGGGATTIEVPVFKDTPAFVFVDGYGGSTGSFTLDVEISTAACGNGIAELPEACDDGNTTAGDGCSPTCTLEGGGVITQCPGQPFLLSGEPGKPRTIGFAGSTLTDGADTQSGSGCFYTDGPNVVYALKSDVTGSVKADLLTGYTKSSLHTRTDCGDKDFQISCTQREEPGTASLSFPTKASEWFYVIVDGYQSGSTVYGGPYSLSVTVTPASCGNHLLDGDEECDDGNDRPGDGCTPDCKLESLPADTCPGHPITLTVKPDGTRTGVVSGNTKNLTHNHAQCILSGSAPDAVYAVTPDIDGYLTATASGPFNTSLPIRNACAETGDAGSYLLACSYKAKVGSGSTPWVLDGLGSDPKRLSLPVTAGSTYYVVVDAVSSGASSRGPFELDVQVRPPTCGNGIIEGTETCDDGGTEPNDGCDATCHLEPVKSRSTCTDAEAVTMTETAPGTWSAKLARGTTNLLANSNISTSTLDDDEACWAPGKNAFFSVTAPAAGVLHAVAKSSSFDVVLNVRKPTCALTTAPLLCANESGKGAEEGLATPIAAGETVYLVVDSKLASEWGTFTLDVSITPSGCGDGFFVPPQEQCDDGNLVSGDGCTGTCTLEPIAGVDVCPGKLLTLAGTGAEPRTGVITFSTASLAGDYAGASQGYGRIDPRLRRSSPKPSVSDLGLRRTLPKLSAKLSECCRRRRRGS